MKKELFSFLVSRENPPHELNLIVKKDISLSFQKKQIILKFVLFQLVGTLFSLTFCPQFGFGLNSAIDISHLFMGIGMWACALFCGTLFLSSGMFVAFLGMKGEELWWIWRRYKMPLIFLPAIFWGVLMLMNLSLNLPATELSFHFLWMVAAMISVGILMTVRGRIYESLKLLRRHS